MNDLNCIVLKPSIKYAFLRCINLFVLMGVLIFIWAYFGRNELLFLLLIPTLFMLYRLVYWKFVAYEITPQQIKYTHGFLQRKIDFLEMYRIKDFDQRQSLIMNMLGIMNIRLMTSDISHPVLEMKGIPKSNIADVLRELIEKSRRENRVYAIDQ